MAVVFKPQTIQLLQGFSQLNPGIVFDPTNSDRIRTVSEDERIIADATIPEVIPSEAGVDDIDAFSNTLNFFSIPSVDFQTVNNRFLVSENDSEETPKQLDYPYTPAAEIVTPPQNNPDISANQYCQILLPYKDFQKLDQAISLDKSREAKQYEKDLTEYQNSVGATPDTPTLTEDQYKTITTNLDELRKFSDSFAEALSAADSNSAPEAPSDTYQYDVVCTLAGGAQVKIYTVKNGVRQTFFIQPQLTSPDFTEEAVFRLNADDLKIIANVDYTATFSIVDNLIQLTGSFPYVETVDNTEQFNQEQAQFEQDVAQYESDAAQFEADQAAYDAAKEANDDLYIEGRENAKTNKVLDVVNGTSPTYEAPTQSEIDAAAAAAGYDPNFATNNPPPTPPTPPTPPDVDAYLTETTFTSSINYWIPVIYETQ